MPERDDQPAKELRREVSETLRGNALEFGISVAALAAVALHLIFREVAIDNVTMALAFLAALPWLARILRSLSLPGVSVEFRDLKEKVDVISDRVDRLDDFVIQGVSNERREKMSEHLAKLRTYLLPFVGDLAKPPRVYVEGVGDMLACYIPDTHEIVIQRRAGDDIDVVGRQYMHSVLAAPPKPVGNIFEIRGLQSGLADYFIASEKGEPNLYRGSGGHEIQLANDRKFVDGFNEHDAGNDLGEIWGGAFWKTRDLLGRSAADAALWNAWMRPTFAGERADDTSIRTDFIDQLIAVVEKVHGEESARQAKQIFAARGVSTRK